MSYAPPCVVHQDIMTRLIFFQYVRFGSILLSICYHQTAAPSRQLTELLEIWKTVGNCEWLIMDGVVKQCLLSDPSLNYSEGRRRWWQQLTQMGAGLLTLTCVGRDLKEHVSKSRTGWTALIWKEKQKRVYITSEAKTANQTVTNKWLFNTGGVFRSALKWKGGENIFFCWFNLIRNPDRPVWLKETVHLSQPWERERPQSDEYQTRVSSLFRGECWVPPWEICCEWKYSSSCFICIHRRIPVKHVRWPVIRSQSCVSMQQVEVGSAGVNHRADSPKTLFSCLSAFGRPISPSFERPNSSNSLLYCTLMWCCTGHLPCKDELSE